MGIVFYLHSAGSGFAHRVECAHTHTHRKKRQTHMQKRHRTQTQFVIYFQEGDFFRGTACLILCGRENLMPLNRFSPGKGEKLDLRTGNFIWEDWLRLRERGGEAYEGSAGGGGEMKIYTAVLNQQRLMSLLLFLPDSLVLQTPPPLPASVAPHQHSGFPHHCQERRRHCQPLLVCQRS